MGGLGVKVENIKITFRVAFSKPQNVIKSEFSFQNDQHNFFKL